MRYTKSHEWIEVDNKGRARIGITEYARKELGEIVHVELPKVGQRLEAGEEVAVVESTKSAADIYTPVSGQVVAVNQSVIDNPNLINLSAEKDGWLYQIALLTSSELETLLDLADYQSFLANS